VSVTTDISNNMDAIDAIMAPVAASNQAMGDAASAGAASTVAKTDHVHGMPNFGVPVAVTTAIGNGVATTIARSDHAHSIAALAIDNAAISATAEIAVSKLADGDALAILRTDAAGTGVEWGSPGQLVFPAAQNASADANTLDDYEEGTWTPSIGGTATYTARPARYIKMGRSVTVECTVHINAVGSGNVGNITGLPFTAGADAALSVGFWGGSATNYVSMTAYVSSGGTTISLFGITAAGNTMGAGATYFANGSFIVLGGTYQV
jgi:hypothetical protein